MATIRMAQKGQTAKLRAVLEADPSKIDHVNKKGQTALMAAVGEDDNADMVEMLLEFGPNLEKLDKQSNSALLIAAQMGFDVVVIRLLTAGADLGRAGPDGLCACHWAIKQGTTRHTIKKNLPDIQPTQSSRSPDLQHWRYVFTPGCQGQSG